MHDTAQHQRTSKKRCRTHDHTETNHHPHKLEYDGESEDECFMTTPSSTASGCLRSSISCHSFSSTESLPSTKKARTTRKQVRFAEALVSQAIPPFYQYYADDTFQDQERLDLEVHQDGCLPCLNRSSMWWTASEYEASRVTLRELCKGFRQARRYCDCLSQVYQTACTLAVLKEPQTVSGLGQVSQPRANENLSQGPFKEQQSIPASPPSLQELLLASSSSSHSANQNTMPNLSSNMVPSPFQQQQQPYSMPTPESSKLVLPPRGLEGYSSRLHALRRARHVAETRRAVFLEQAMQSILSSSTSSNNNNSDEAIQRLAETSAQASLNSRWMAMVWGHADAAWVVEQQKTLQELN